jgi:hypothetical protein
MTKKACKQQEAQFEGKVRRRLSNTPSRTLAESRVAQPVQPPSREAPGQVYSSEEQALEVLVESIVGKLADSPKEQREMAEFLDTVLETDPELRREILASATIRK